MRRTALFVISSVIFAAAAARLHGRQTRDAAAGTAIATGTSTITGVVLTGETPPQPIRRAVVTVVGAELPTGRSAVTDDAGRFNIGQLPAGRYIVSASKAAFLPGAYGAKRPGRPGTPLAIAAGQTMDVSVRMSRGAVVTGSVRDAANQPVAGLQVRVVETSGSAAQSSPADSAAPAFTDDRGAYRIYGLAPGEYVVVTMPMRLQGNGPVRRMSDEDVDAALAAISRTDAPARPAAPIVDAPGRTTTVAFGLSYFPGTPIYANAARVTLAAGEERNGLDFAVTAAPSARIAGTVLSPDGAALPVQISITPDLPRALSSMSSNGTNPVLSLAPGPDGRFEFSNVAPGHYIIVARAMAGSSQGVNNGLPTVVNGVGGGGVSNRSASPTQSNAIRESRYAREELDVDGRDIPGVTLTLHTGSTLNGRAVFDGSTQKPPANLTTITVGASQTNVAAGYMMMSNGTLMGLGGFSVPPVPLKSDGTFAVAGLMPATFTLRYTLPADSFKGWWLRSAMLDGRDLLDEPFDVKPGVDLSGVVLTFTDRHTELSGALHTDLIGSSVTDYSLVVYPADRALWRPESRRIRSTNPGTDGTFSVIDLPGGEYLVSALADLDPRDLADPNFLSGLSRSSVHVTIVDGQKTVQNISVGG